MTHRDQVMIEAAELGRLIAAGEPISLLAVRNVGAAGLPGFAAQPRIPGAIDIDLPSHLAAPGGGVAGSRPLPAIADLERNARRWGLRQDRPIVLYDHDRCLTAARGWWVLRWAGLRDVRLLNGGFPAWQAAGLPQANAPGQPEPSTISLSAGHMKVLDADGAAAQARDGLLLDTRIRGNYIGGPVAAGEARRGHIPGSISAPAADALTEAGLFLDNATLEHLFAALGVDRARPVGISCGAGVSAAHTVAALAALGIEAAMFPGSWSAWSADPDRPVVVGGRPE